MHADNAMNEPPLNLLALGKYPQKNPFRYLALLSPNLASSTDGGGIRGVSELVILHEIMTRLQHDLMLEHLPRPCDYFHLIGGTSTGG